MFVGDAMPNRVIRDSALASKKLATVSAEAERLFWRLLMVADDFGRFQAEPSLLLARCFPLQVKSYSAKQVSKWYAELTRCGAIIGYSVGEDSFGQFLVWNQRSRAEKSKYPPSDDGQVTVIRPSAAHVDEDVDEDVDVRRRRSSADADGFNDFWNAYPKKKAKGDAERAWKGIIPDAALQARIRAAVASQALSDDWQRDAGKWIPYPATWLRAKRWEDTQDVGPPKGIMELEMYRKWKPSPAPVEEP